MKWPGWFKRRREADVTVTYTSEDPDPQHHDTGTPGHVAYSDETADPADFGHRDTDEAATLEQVGDLGEAIRDGIPDAPEPESEA